jgi:DNA (cytosine-5)-methyltransferase 1
MRYFSVCSGIEAASVAWGPLGWQCAGVAEVATFPSAVLAYRFPEVPNYGDFTKIEADAIGPIDLLVGGTPCQAFSIAGLRGGLGDDRGNLALEFLSLADRLRPRWICWENVPGVFSSLSHAAPDPCPPPAPMDMGCDGQEVDTEDEYDSEELHAFNCFLAGLSEIGYGFAYRVLDAQYDGLAQRRERVFVIGYLGDWRPAAAVLADRESLSWHSAPCREPGQRAAPTISARPTAGGGLGTDFDLDGGLIAHALRAEGFDASEAGANTGFACGDVPGALRGEGNGGGHAAFAGKAGVRRITPREAERLMGFSDDFTRIPWRGRRAEDCPDGPRYKAIGNSMAVPCMRWIGERINIVRKALAAEVLA